MTVYRSYHLMITAVYGHEHMIRICCIWYCGLVIFRERTIPPSYRYFEVLSDTDNDNDTDTGRDDTPNVKYHVMLHCYCNLVGCRRREWGDRRLLHGATSRPALRYM